MPGRASSMGLTDSSRLRLNRAGLVLGLHGGGGGGATSAAVVAVPVVGTAAFVVVDVVAAALLEQAAPAQGLPDDAPGPPLVSGVGFEWELEERCWGGGGVGMAVAFFSPLLSPPALQAVAVAGSLVVFLAGVPSTVVLVVASPEEPGRARKAVGAGRFMTSIASPVNVLSFAFLYLAFVAAVKTTPPREKRTSVNETTSTKRNEVQHYLSSTLESLSNFCQQTCEYLIIIIIGEKAGDCRLKVLHCGLLYDVAQHHRAVHKT